jgi:hypothetical protein
MKRLKLWIVVALTAAFAMSIIGTVTAQPSPPTIFRGTVTDTDGSPVAAGLPVEAFIDGTDCTNTGATLADSGYYVTVENSSTRDGCGGRGSEVRFRVGGQWASTTGTVGSSGFQRLNLALGPETVDIEVRVWQLQSDPLRLFISARPPGATWNDFGTIRLPMDDGPFTHSSGALLDIEDTTLNVTLQSGETVDIEIRVWQLQSNPLRVFISARPPGATWNDFGTIRLAMDDGPFTHSSGALLDIEDTTLSVTLAGGSQ